MSARILSRVLRSYDIININAKIYHNLTYKNIKDRLVKENVGSLASNEAYCVNTGKYTGRSPDDRFLVDNTISNKNINWGNVNKPISNTMFNKLYTDVVNEYSKNENIYIFDGYCGTCCRDRKHVRFLTKYAWQHNFVKNMFIRVDEDVSRQLLYKKPDFTVLNCSDIKIKQPKNYNLNSEAFSIFNIDRELGIIGGTSYAGEMKKGIFSMMNYWLPMKGVLTMHCSANVGEKNDTALFFGLSGTGKTTLSADPKRKLIGDDEHGWNDDGIYNLEGGCYAKTVDLNVENEPDIFNAIKENTILENVYLEDGKIDYYNKSLTENGRASYPISHINNYSTNEINAHPNNIIFLTCDAFGVIPPISKLNPKEAMYHFLSGYTAKIAGTERGIVEPVATFSACFGEPFLPLHPYKYAKLLEDKIEKHGSNVYLVNTGWYKGGYGVGERMNLGITRACIDAILGNKMQGIEFVKSPVFNLSIPQTLENLDSSILNPVNNWQDKSEYYKKAEELQQMFTDNFNRYEDMVY